MWPNSAVPSNGALLLLASATPSVESYHAAVSGRYTLHTLSSRYGSASLPEVEVVDMRAEPPAEEGASPEPAAAGGN